MDNPCVAIGENCDNDEICCTQRYDESSKKCECIEEGNCSDDGDCCGDMTCEHNSIYGEWICIDGGCRDINWQCNQNSDCCTNYCNDVKQNNINEPPDITSPPGSELRFRQNGMTSIKTAT